MFVLAEHRPAFLKHGIGNPAFMFSRRLIDIALDLNWVMSCYWLYTFGWFLLAEFYSGTLHLSNHSDGN